MPRLFASHGIADVAVKNETVFVIYEFLTLLLGDMSRACTKPAWSRGRRPTRGGPHRPPPIATARFSIGSRRLSCREPKPDRPTLFTTADLACSRSGRARLFAVAGSIRPDSTHRRYRGLIASLRPSPLYFQQLALPRGIRLGLCAT